MRFLAGLLAILLVNLAQAQSYPSKPIRMLLAFPPGGPTDINARLFAQKLSEQTGQQVVVDNKPGAGGNLAATEAAKAPADGYTIFYNTSAITIAPALYSSIQYDPLKDYAPGALASNGPLVRQVKPGNPAKTLQD